MTTPLDLPPAVGGFPPENDPASGPLRDRTYYELLQVSPTAEGPILEAAYQALVRRLEEAPFDARTSARQTELREAYRVLSNPHRRAIYDLMLKERAAMGQQDGQAARVVRKTRCWRCRGPLDALAPYCSDCHWLVCRPCGACGCEHPEWRDRVRVCPQQLSPIVGWVVAALLGVVLVIVLLYPHFAPVLP